MTASRSIVVSCALVLAAVTGCGREPRSPGVPGVPELEIAEPWARVTPAGVTVGAAYMTLMSRDGDRLLGVDVPSTLAARVELHQVVADSVGRLGMSRVEAIDLPAHTPVVLEPGAHHVMFFDLAAPFVEGDTLTLGLRFERAGTRTVRVPVQP